MIRDGAAVSTRARGSGDDAPEGARVAYTYNPHGDGEEEPVWAWHDALAAAAAAFVEVDGPPQTVAAPDAAPDEAFVAVDRAPQAVAVPDAAPDEEEVPVPLGLLGDPEFHDVEGLPQRRRALRPIPPGAVSLMVRNIPWAYSQEELLEEWIPDGSFNYLHLPFNRALARPIGYAYINFTSNEALMAFQDQWHGRFLARHHWRKPLDIAAARAQGFDANMVLLEGNVDSLEEAGFLPMVFDGLRRVDARDALQLVLSRQ